MGAESVCEYELDTMDECAFEWSFFSEFDAEFEHPIQFLDSRWLIRFDGIRLPRRQDLPEEAFCKHLSWEHQSWDKAPRVVCLSYVWQTPEHPDPSGTTLRLLQTALRQLHEFERLGGADTYQTLASPKNLKIHVPSLTTNLLLCSGTFAR